MRNRSLLVFESFARIHNLLSFFRRCQLWRGRSPSMSEFHFAIVIPIFVTRCVVRATMMTRWRWWWWSYCYYYESHPHFNHRTRVILQSWWNLSRWFFFWLSSLPLCDVSPPDFPLVHMLYSPLVMVHIPSSPNGDGNDAPPVIPFGFPRPAFASPHSITQYIKSINMILENNYYPLLHSSQTLNQINVSK